MDADVLFVGFLALSLGLGKLAVRRGAKYRLALALAFLVIVPPTLPLFSHALSLSAVTVGVLIVWCTTLGVTYGWLATRLAAES